MSVEIIDEAIEILIERRRLRTRYNYSLERVGQYQADLLTLAHIVHHPPPMPGAVPRDPDDDKIIARAVAASADYLVTRDHDLLSLGNYGPTAMITPEEFLSLVRAQET